MGEAKRRKQNDPTWGNLASQYLCKGLSKFPELLDEKVISELGVIQFENLLPNQLNAHFELLNSIIAEVIADIVKICGSADSQKNFLSQAELLMRNLTTFNQESWHGNLSNIDSAIEKLNLKNTSLKDANFTVLTTSEQKELSEFYKAIFHTAVDSLDCVKNDRKFRIALANKLRNKP